MVFSHCRGIRLIHAQVALVFTPWTDSVLYKARQSLFKVYVTVGFSTFIHTTSLFPYARFLFIQNMPDEPFLIINAAVGINIRYIYH